MDFNPFVSMKKVENDEKQAAALTAYINLILNKNFIY